jgi:hypothetical protein
MQDLTQRDILTYVKDRLGSHRLMIEAEEMEMGISSRIIRDITTKAAGVFLWVFLVVARLIRCLQDYDLVQEMEEEINRLPEDLEKLYRHLLEAIPKKNCRLGAKYLQLAVRSAQKGFSVHLWQLSYVEEDHRSVLAAPIQPTDPKAAAYMCKGTEGRLRSRCLGLLEPTTDYGMALLGGYKIVSFMHRTVFKSLTSADV